ncbi:hypothetical protein Riv7116_0582 [Rivularia sp. PCC 7116]|uniref:DUF6745 domain-containing protein n=1 Tax=Rivularia sp. PCC 7116 TaxID=373994 RepID=UPI00029F1379|nr:hypothetical protein [Rivularia sp. PCC 7116]AFY53176.1 hypothetical protein Riv7116_0582 [Rivularia sp. PCC 7116]
MSESKFTKLTSEQEALIPVYREKWKKIALSTERIDKEKATEAVKQAYSFVGEKEPKMLFCRSPIEILQELQRRKKENIVFQPLNKIWKLFINLHDNIIIKLEEKFGEYIDDEIYLQLSEPINLCCEEIWGGISSTLFNRNLFPLFYELGNDCKFSHETIHASFLDYYLNVLNISINKTNKSQWEIYKSLVLSCSWIFFGKNTCFVSERPFTLFFDDENLLHADAKPAIEYSDAIKVYAYHGMIIPEKYGKHHPNQWKPSWLLQERNAELRKILIQEICYSRILEELQAIELDSYQEYTLLKINSDIDIEPIYLLKMICPSTGNIHVLRVPPQMKTAREAITWVNWGIPPEDFAIQT